MIDKYLKKQYINNYSDIICFSNDIKFKKIISILDENHFIKVTSNLIHKTNEINQIEQFIFNLDNYITYLKQLIHITPLELRYIINLTIYNKYNKILYSDLYYYSNIEKYNNEFKKMFMYNYNINQKKFNLKKRNFNELIELINKHKKRTYCYFENITNNNMNLYSAIIEEIESLN